MAALAGRGVDNAVVELDGPEVPVAGRIGGAVPVPARLRRDRDAGRAAPADRGAAAGARRGRRGVRRVAPRAHGWRLRAGGLDRLRGAPRSGGRRCRCRFWPARSAARWRRRAPSRWPSEVEALQEAGFGARRQPGQRGGGGRRAGAEPRRACAWRTSSCATSCWMRSAISALAGAALRGRLVAHRPGHTLNNRLLRALFADAAAWREIVVRPGVRRPALSDWSAVPAAA